MSKKPVVHRLRAPHRRQAILDSALPLFARVGFHGVTTRQLAAAAGVSEPILYRHFPSKEALWQEIQARCLAGVAQRRGEIAALSTDTATLVLAIHFLVNISVSKAVPDRSQLEDLGRILMLSTISEGKFARRFMDAEFQPLYEKLVACLKAADAAGDVVPMEVPHSIRILMVQHMAAMTAAYRMPSPPVFDHGAPDEATLVDQITRIALRAIGLGDEAIRTFYTPKAWRLLRG